MKLRKSAGIAPMSVKDGGAFSGYAATFDRVADCYGDVIAKGAFAETLEAWSEKNGDGVFIPVLYDHDTSDPMHNIGRITKAYEDERGLFVEGEFDADNETAQYVRKLAQEGRIYQFSFAYDVKGSGIVELDGGEKANELQKLDLYEVSIVQIPANQNAVMTGVKSADGGSAAVSRLREMAQGIIEAIDGLGPVIGMGSEGGCKAKAEEPREGAANAEERKRREELMRKATILIGE